MIAVSSVILTILFFIYRLTRTAKSYINWIKDKKNKHLYFKWMPVCCVKHRLWQHGILILNLCIIAYDLLFHTQFHWQNIRWPNSSFVPLFSLSLSGRSDLQCCLLCSFHFLLHLFDFQLFCVYDPLQVWCSLCVSAPVTFRVPNFDSQYISLTCSTITD